MGNRKVRRSRGHLKSGDGGARLQPLGAGRGFEGSRGSTIPPGEAPRGKGAAIYGARRAGPGRRERARPTPVCHGMFRWVFSTLPRQALKWRSV